MSVKVTQASQLRRQERRVKRQETREEWGSRWRRRRKKKNKKERLPLEVLLLSHQRIFELTVCSSFCVSCFSCCSLSSSSFHLFIIIPFISYFPFLSSSCDVSSIVSVLLVHPTRDESFILFGDKTCFSVSAFLVIDCLVFLHESLMNSSSSTDPFPFMTYSFFLSVDPDNFLFLLLLSSTKRK